MVDGKEAGLVTGYRNLNFVKVCCHSYQQNYQPLESLQSFELFVNCCRGISQLNLLQGCQMLSSQPSNSYVGL